MPADTGTNQEPDHDKVQEALENGDPFLSETQVAVGFFENGYNPYTDNRFSSFADYDQANLIWYYTLWTAQTNQVAGISAGGDDFWGLLAAGSGMATGTIKTGTFGGPTTGKRFPQSVRQQAFDENPSRICVFCQMEGTASQVDHAYPRSLGGDATIENAQLACPHCNASKGNGTYPKSPPAGYEGEWLFP